MYFSSVGNKGRPNKTTTLNTKLEQKKSLTIISDLLLSVLNRIYHTRTELWIMVFLSFSFLCITDLHVTDHTDQNAHLCLLSQRLFLFFPDTSLLLCSFNSI